MKKLKQILLVSLCILLFGGCKNKNIVEELTKKIENAKSYQLAGTLEIINDENSYMYDVDVKYLKDNNFKVSLKNKTNNHEQIILRNDEGVYVLTPSLNKSFKFQSDWPYNNSQSYILQNIIKDIKNDEEYKLENQDNNYIITTKVNYPNNKELVNEKIYINKDKNIEKIEVLDENNNIKIKMTIDNIDYNANNDTNIFKLENNLTVSNEQPTSKLEEIIYPMYLPKNTYLQSEDKVSNETGERVIMTFQGDYPFMLIQETINQSEAITSVKGEPYQLATTVGIIDDTSLTWFDEKAEYYLVSNELNKEELIEVANSLTAAAIEK